MRNKSLFAFMSLLISVIVVTPVHSKKNQDDESSGDVIVSSSDMAVTVSNHARSISTMSNQVNEVVSKMQTMDGDIAKNERKDMDQDKVLKDSQLRLQTLEDKISMLTGQLHELKVEGLLKPTAGQRLDEFRTYSKALEYVNARNYKQAITDLQAYQSANKKSVFSDYAQYWIGEAYYLQSDYEMAISEYQKLVSKDPKSIKAPSALYKQGLSFFYLQSFDDAKEFLSKVIRNYPQSIEAVQASSQIARINNILDLRKRQQDEQKAVEQSM